MSDPRDTLNQMFLTYQKNLTMMLQGCKTSTQHDQIVDSYVKARDAYYDSIAKSFTQNDALLQGLITDATTVTAELTKIGSQLGNIATVIGYATQAATLAGKIAALGV